MDSKPVTLGDWDELLKIEDFVLSARFLAKRKVAPDWVALFLKEWASEVIERREHADTNASREHTMSRLAEIESLATQLADLLEDKTVMKFLQMPPQRPFQSELGTRMFVSEIAMRAHEAATSPSLLRGTGRKNSGSGKAVPSDEVSPEQLCAIIIAEAWFALHGSPQTSDKDAAKAASAYWAATGGLSTRSVGNSPTGKWTEYFRNARDERLHWGKRKEMKRQLEFYLNS
jgi:hypothetical protein